MTIVVVVEGGEAIAPEVTKVKARDPNAAVAIEDPGAGEYRIEVEPSRGKDGAEVACDE